MPGANGPEDREFAIICPNGKWLVVDLGGDGGQYWIDESVIDCRYTVLRTCESLPEAAAALLALVVATPSKASAGCPHCPQCHGSGCGFCHGACIICQTWHGAPPVVKG